MYPRVEKSFLVLSIERLFDKILLLFTFSFLIKTAAETTLRFEKKEKEKLRLFFIYEKSLFKKRRRRSNYVTVLSEQEENKN